MGFTGFPGPQGISASGGGGSGVAISDEGTGQGTATTVNFVGAGVTATVAAGTATVTIPGASGAIFDPSTSSVAFDDFIGSLFGGAPLFVFSWSTTFVGAGASIQTVAGDVSHIGVVEIDTGTTATGIASLFLDYSAVNGEAFQFGGGQQTLEWLVNIPTLSTAGEEYDIFVGFIDQTSGAAQIDGAYFKYNRNVSVNWITGTSSNSTATETATSTAVATGWSKLKIVVNSGGTSVEYFVNGVSIGTNTTNIPTVGRHTSIGISIQKSASAGVASAVRADYMNLSIAIDTPR